MQYQENERTEVIRRLELKESDVHKLGNALKRIIEPSLKHDSDQIKMLDNMINRMIKDAHLIKELLSGILNPI